MDGSRGLNALLISKLLNLVSLLFLPLGTSLECYALTSKSIFHVAMHAGDALNSDLLVCMKLELFTSFLQSNFN